MPITYNNFNMKKERIAIAGAGLVGSLLACLLANEGYTVDIFERRPDPRKANLAGGRSINLALSDRGWKALRMAKLEQAVRENVIPMHGRMMHNVEGELTFQAYGQEGQFINSVSRGGLNELLLTNADQHEQVNIHFSHRCLDIDFEAGKLHLENTETGEATIFEASVILGADGAFSAIRGAMQKTDRFNYAQRYIEAGYKELSMPPNKDGSFKLDKNALHIWPRGQFMLIALPNLDGSFTCTLFLDFEGEVSFEKIQTREDAKAFFQKYFPDVLPLIDDLEEQFFNNPTSSLVTVRCSPWKKGKALLVGDAAHAIVPFYGQGMNSGFEDCTVLMDLLRKHDWNWEAAGQEFSDKHIPNAYAIADLALRNFIEMRDSVADEQFLLRKKIEARLHQEMPKEWMPLYSMVTFSHIPYSEALAVGKKQDQIMATVLQRPDVLQWEEDAVFSQIKKQAINALA